MDPWLLDKMARAGALHPWERRAAGEAEFCDCGVCVTNAQHELRTADRIETRWVGPFEGARMGALLRALVLQALLDPGTWWQPGIAPPREAP